MQKLLIDTDPGQDIDDLMAIWFALLRPEIDVLAVTTVTWPSDRRARLVKRLLRHLGREAIPVAPGMQFPLRPLDESQRARLLDDRHSMNHACFAEPADPRDDPDGGDAVDLIIRTIRRHPGQVAIAAIAPLTNIAAALCRDPQIAPQIRHIALMGGEVALPRAEHNIAFDPVAADIVFRAGVPLFIGPWSVTRQFTLTLEECASMFGNASPLAEAMTRAVAAWHPAQSWKPGPVMYDLFPFVHAVDPSLYTLEPREVRVELHGEHTRGWTVARTGDAPNARVTTAVDVEAVRALYSRTVLGS